MEIIEDPLLYFEVLLNRTQESVKSFYMQEAMQNNGQALEVNLEEGTFTYYSSFYNDITDEIIEGEFT